jgi:hypothetical protein
MNISVQPQSYLDFLKSKITIAPDSGIEFFPEDCNPILKPHERDSVLWGVKGGRRAWFSSFGLGKTVTQLEAHRLILSKTEGKALITAPLNVVDEFYHDAEHLLSGLPIEYVKTQAEAEASKSRLVITNYERVRDGDIRPDYFASTSLDEASVLRSYGSKTYQEFLLKFQKVPYRFVATATPSPNKYKELIHYAGFLGIMDTGQALTRFFHRDSTHANNLTLYPHKEKEFWFWVSTWALFITKPSDLGYSDEGYELPPLDVRYHVVDVDHATAGTEQDGQNKMFRDAALGLKDAAKEKRESIDTRVEQIKKILHNSIKSFNIGEEYGQKRISQEILRGSQREYSEKTEREECKELSREQGIIQKEKYGMENEESRKIQGITEKQFNEEQKEEYRTIEGLAREEQDSGSGTEKRIEDEEIRNNNSDISRDGEITKLEVPDMRENSGGSSSEQEGRIDCGSLPFNKEGSRPSLSSLQYRTRSISGQRGIDDEGDHIFEQFVIWVELDDEQDAVEKMLKNEGISFTSLRGSQDVEYRSTSINKWKGKETVVFVSKLKMYGYGINMQNCHRMIFAGISYKFSDFIQGIHRQYRFGQTEQVRIDIISAESEQAILDTLKKKWDQHIYLVEQMTKIIRENGLASTNVLEKLARTITFDREEVKGKAFTAVLNDNCMEWPNIPDNTFDLIHTSIPFSNHYEYTPTYNDFGHNTDNDRFFEQMDFLTPHLLRTLKPGKVAAIHVKDRILFGNATGTGMPTVDPFSDMTVFHFLKHGFQYMGRITVVTDVVRENNQTYRLGWTEQCKDGTKMGVGCPEYVLLFRKLPSDTSRAYADEPVKKTKQEYTRAQWQIDAHAFWKSSGDRLLLLEELRNTEVSNLQAKFRQFSRDNAYNYHDHVQLADDLEEDEKLPASFMVVAPGTTSEWVWDDVNRMRTLNGEQARKELEFHICPLQFDIVERIINRYSNKGDLVADPFAGLFTVPYMAVKMGRRGFGTEINVDSFRDGLVYLKAADIEVNAPTLFDLEGI